MEWLSAREAAERLGISDVRVRQLGATGELLARRHSAGWLIAEEAVEARRQSPPHAGRPLKPENAWLLLTVLADASQELAGHGDAPGRRRMEQARASFALRCAAAHGEWPSDLRQALSGHTSMDARLLSAFRWRPFEDVDEDQKRSLRRALRHAVRSIPEPGRWSRWLARRSETWRYWAHPGVMSRLRSDGRLSLGGAWAAAIAGADIAPDDKKLEFYVREDDRDGVIRDYRLQPDPGGTVTLRSIPRRVPDSLIPQPPEPVAPVVAALDLLESRDARSNELGKSLLKNLREVLRFSEESSDHDGSQREEVSR